MSKRKTPEKPDTDNPEWTAGDFQRARPFQALPDALRKTLQRRGRPPKAAPKVAVSIRLSPDVLAHFKAKGKGWQTRLDAALRQWVKDHKTA
jgi:uncharacterized protein (DUF4415 family)